MSIQTTYYIGDVHGCRDLLETMLQHIEEDAGRNENALVIAFLGDITDRGPESMECMELVHRTLAEFPGSVLHLGNHDEWFLDAIRTEGKFTDFESWFIHGGSDTIRSYCNGEIDQGVWDIVRTRYPHHVKMLEDATLYTTNGPFVAAHAGMNPYLPLAEQKSHDLNWIRDPFLMFVEPGMPPVIHGHTIVGKLPVVTENRISIDTGAFRNGRLTCLKVDAAEGKLTFWQSCENGYVMEVQPILLDRGYGTVFDRLPQLFSMEDIPALAT